MPTARKPLPAVNGLPVYRCDEIPDGLMHQTGLAEIGRKPAKSQPVLGYVRYWGNRTAPLYAVADAAVKRAVSDQQRAQLAAASAARFACPRCGLDLRDSPTPPWASSDRCGSCVYSEVNAKIEQARLQAVAWSKGMLARSRSDVAIADTESAWLHGPVCELGITDVEGNVLFHSVVNPLVKIDPEAMAIHGITDDEARRAPTLRELFPQVTDVLRGRHVLFWNAEYDTDVLRREALRAHGLPWEARAIWAKQAGGATWHSYNEARRWMGTWTSECLMEWYSQFHGDFDPETEDYRWQKLRGNHRALGDCRAALDRLIEMAGIQRARQLALPLGEALTAAANG